jgi:hypothetical protein
LFIYHSPSRQFLGYAKFEVLSTVTEEYRLLGYHPADLVRTDVSWGCITFIFRVERIGELGTTTAFKIFSAVARLHTGAFGSNAA